MNIAKHLILSLSFIACYYASTLEAMEPQRQPLSPTPIDKLLQAIGRKDLNAVKEAVERDRAPLSYAGRTNFAFGPPLADAVSEGNLAIVNYLISKGAPLDEPNRWGQRPLSIAVGQDRADMVQALLQAGADPNLKSSGIPRDQTPLEYARQYNRRNQKAIIDLLQRHSAQ
jgi:ankyrin repeat protein